MLHNRHEFEVRVVEARGVGDQLVSQFAIRQQAVALAVQPATQVDLIDRHRLMNRIARGTLCHPGIVAPVMAAKRPHNAGGLGREFGVETVGVALVLRGAELGEHGIFVGGPAFEARHEYFPDAAVAQAHRMAGAVPAVEIAHHAHHRGVGSPHREAHAIDAFTLDGVRAHGAVTFVVGAFAVQVQLEGREQGREAVGIVEFEDLAGVEADSDTVVETGRGSGVEAGLVGASHLNDRTGDDEPCGFGLGEPSADGAFVGSENCEGVTVPSGYDGFDCRCLHLCIMSVNRGEHAEVAEKRISCQGRKGRKGRPELGSFLARK